MFGKDDQFSAGTFHFMLSASEEMRSQSGAQKPKYRLILSRHPYMFVRSLGFTASTSPQLLPINVDHV